MALPFFAPPTFPRRRRGAGEFVDVLARTGPGRLARHGRDDFTVGHRLHAVDGSHHGDGGLAPAGDHVDVHLAFADMLLEVDRRHAEGADGRGREIDHERPFGVHLAAVLCMGVSAGGVKDDLYTVGLHVRHQAVHTVRSGLEPHLAGALETVGLGVDADHPDRLQYGAALQLGQQVGADVAGSDHGAFDFIGHVLSFRKSHWNCTEQSPMPPTLTRKWSPA